VSKIWVAAFSRMSPRRSRLMLRKNPRGAAAGEIRVE
jgi:hypothetical protein